MRPPPLIRPLDSLEDFQACAALQASIWGESFGELVPPALLAVTQKMGGVASGAFDSQGRMVGFVFGISGLHRGTLSHWSHMLGVRKDARDGGLGFRLKCHQREELLGRGIRRMLWTFDPLESRNAYLNFCKLGAVSSEYVPDMYGTSDSPLHSHIGTDRLVVEWRLDSPRVVERLSGHGAVPPDSEPPGLALAVAADPHAGLPPRPERRVVPPEASGALVTIPADIQALKASEPELARAWRQDTREAFVDLLDRGMQIREVFHREAVSLYLLARSGAET